MILSRTIARLLDLIGSTVPPEPSSDEIEDIDRVLSDVIAPMILRACPTRTDREEFSTHLSAVTQKLKFLTANLKERGR